MPTHRALLVAPSCVSIQEGAPLEVDGYPGREGPVRLRFYTHFDTVEGAPDRLPRTFVGVHGSRDAAVIEATSWAVGWLRRLRAVSVIEKGENDG